MPSETCLITGGSGFIGSHLTEVLRDKGYRVHILTRSDAMTSRQEYFTWSVTENKMDPEALHGVDHLIHLAGANIGSHRWSASRKSKIINSRVDSLKFLFDQVKKNNHRIKSVISISGIGYYGAVTSDHIFHEDDPPGDDFLGQTSQAWEQTAHMFEEVNVRTVIFRTPMVLSGNGGALPRLMIPVRLGLGAPVGTGYQYMPWVHIDDLCNVFVKALMDTKMTGTFNVCASQQPNNREFMQMASQAVHRPFLLPAIPNWIFRLVYGEMAVIILEGSRISNEKLLSTGFRFTYSDLKAALNQIYS